MKTADIIRKRKNKCKCGCGAFTKNGNIYLRGHYAKDPHSKNKSGWNHSEEAKNKMSLARLGVTSPRKGVKLSESTKQKLRESKLGSKLSEETKSKIKESVHKTYSNPVIRKKCGHPQIISEKHKAAVKKFMLTAWKNPEFKEKLIGKNANNWQGGKSFEPYSAAFNNQLKNYIRIRDNNKCQNPDCFNKTQILNIHHIDYNKINCSEFNLILLCTSCNSRANFNRNSWETLYKEIIKSKYENIKRTRRKIS